MFKAGSEAPHGIDIGSNQVAPLIIELEDYVLTNDLACGSLVYRVTITSDTDADFDPLTLGMVTQADNVLTFNLDDMTDNPYPLGTLTVTVNVRANITSDITYTQTFDIIVVKCQDEAIQAVDLDAATWSTIPDTT